jgi:di/tricarboxylate transporter
MLPPVNWETVQIVIVLGLVVVVFFGFVRETISPDIVSMSAVGVLLMLGILSTGEVLEVFSNPAPISVAGMLVLSAALERTGVVEAMGRLITRIRWPSPLSAMVAMSVLVALVSAFMNNTPVVVILTPVMFALAHALRVAPSKFLIPLSFASIFGGTCTLIGTSTNLLVDGVAQAHGAPGFGMFEITVPGTALAVVGILYLALFGNWLLPDRKTLADSVPDLAKRQFLTEVLVAQQSPLVGKTPKEAGLTVTRGYHVIDVIRDEISFDPEFGVPALRPGDRLVLRTNVADVMSLRSGGGVVFDTGESKAEPPPWEPITSRNAVIMEGILAPNSRFVGQRVGDLNLRRLYGVYILAIHRQNEALHGNFDQVRLAFGDTLLLEGPPAGLKRLFDTHELVNLSEPQARPFRRDKAPVALLAVVGIMLLAGFEVLPIAALALIAAILVVALGCLDVEEAYNAIQWRLMMLIFGMLALGTAMDTSGAARLLVEAITDQISGFGPLAVLSILYLITSVLTAVMSNNATAILLTPIAFGLAEGLNADPRPFVAAVMFAASASFATPIGYQTNTFVYTAGGYRFVDFVRIGLPLSILLWLVSIVVIPMYWPLTGTR